MRLQVQVDGARHELTPGRTYVVGRGTNADVVVGDPQVSRNHVELMFHNGAWIAVDRSSGGSYAFGQRFQSLRIEQGLVISLGPQGSPMVAFALVPDAPAAPTPAAPAPMPAPTPPAPPVPQNAPPAAQVPGPPPALVLQAPHVPAAGNTVALDDRALRLELDGQTRTFQVGQRAVLGRGPDCDMTTTDQLVSAQHCAFTHDGNSWWVEDLNSTRGTFIDHKRVTRKKIQGAFFVRLGDDDAGVPVRVVTAGVHNLSRDRRPLFIASAALAVVLLGGLIAALFWPDGSDSEAQIAALQEQIEQQREQTDEQIAEAQEQAEQAIADANAAGGAGNSPGQLMAARLSTALILVPDESGEIVSSGSGPLISDDGLILTNIHVVLPATEFDRTGAREFVGSFDPDEVLVGFPSTDGGPADLFFVAEQVEAHPAHDAALIRVVSGVDGAQLSDLPDPLPIGESGALRAGDQIAVVGYPGEAGTERVSVSLSNFQSFQPCAGTETDAFFGCLRNYDEGYLNMAGETLTSGSSGGPILSGGEVVGIQLGVAGAQDLGVPIDLVLDELDVD